MELRVTKKSERKARKRRERGELRWIPLKIVILLGIIIGTAGLIVIGKEINKFFATMQVSNEMIIGALALSFGYVIAIDIKMLLIEKTGYEIKTRGICPVAEYVNDKEYRVRSKTGEGSYDGQIEFKRTRNGQWFLVEKFATRKSARGIKMYHIFESDIRSICGVRYDDESGKLSFVCSGVERICTNKNMTGVVERRVWHHSHIEMYDKYEPELVDAFLRFRIRVF